MVFPQSSLVRLVSDAGTAIGSQDKTDRLRPRSSRSDKRDSIRQTQRPDPRKLEPPKPDSRYKCPARQTWHASDLRLWPFLTRATYQDLAQWLEGRRRRRIPPRKARY